MAASFIISPYQVYNIYRFGLASVLWGLVYLDRAPSFFGAFIPQAFLTTLTLYWVTTLLLLYLAELKKAESITLIFFGFLCDILAWGILLHSSGGITTGFGLVYVIICASAALLLPRQLALFIASVSVLGLIGQEIWMQHLLEHRNTAFSQVGGHGVLLFTTTLMILWLKNRIQLTESVAQSFSQINEEIITLMDVGVIVYDGKNAIVHVNNAASRLLKFEPGSLSTLESLPTLYHDVFIRGKNYFPHQHRRFQQLPMPPYTLLLVFDTKKEAKHAQQLRLAALGQMASNIAHEIRNPLSAITQASDHLKSRPENTTALIEIIERQALRMNQIIETVLSLSKQSKPDMRWFHINDCLSSIVVPKSDFTIRKVNTHCLINSDFSMLEQVLTILIENAAQHATEVSITLDHDDEGGACIDVKDNGPGVEQQDIPSIFDPFFTKNPHGTGLGLFLAQRLCDALGAELYYIEQSEGALFRICLGPKVGIVHE